MTIKQVGDGIIGIIVNIISGTCSRRTQGEPLYEAADGSVPAETGRGGGEGLRATALFDYQAGR